SVDTSTLARIISEVRRKHITLQTIIFFNAVFACEEDLLVDLLKASDTIHVVIIECQLSAELASSLAENFDLPQPQLRTYFIGSCDSFEAYIETIGGLEKFGKITKLNLEWTLSFVSETSGRAQLTVFCCLHRFSPSHGIPLHYHVIRNGNARNIEVIKTRPDRSMRFYKFVFHPLDGGLYPESAGIHR
ncbi:unnamed protein product, partial [Cylicocyclus nassatus]